VAQNFQLLGNELELVTTVSYSCMNQWFITKFCVSYHVTRVCVTHWLLSRCPV